MTHPYAGYVMFFTMFLATSIYLAFFFNWMIPRLVRLIKYTATLETRRDRMNARLDVFFLTLIVTPFVMLPNGLFQDALFRLLASIETNERVGWLIVFGGTAFMSIPIGHLRIVHKSRVTSQNKTRREGTL